MSFKKDPTITINLVFQTGVGKATIHIKFNLGVLVISKDLLKKHWLKSFYKILSVLSMVIVLGNIFEKLYEKKVQMRIHLEKALLWAL